MRTPEADARATMYVISEHKDVVPIARVIIVSIIQTARLAMSERLKAAQGKSMNPEPRQDINIYKGIKIVCVCVCDFRRRGIILTAVLAAARKLYRPAYDRSH